MSRNLVDDELLRDAPDVHDALHDPHDDFTIVVETDRVPVLREHTASDGYVFKYRHWRPEAAVPRGYVVALHGIQSHPGWYEYSTARVCEAGWDVRYLDRRGAGLNLLDRGHAPHAERLINDVGQILRDVRWERDRVDPGLPIVLLAVSWGGKLAAATCGHRPELVDALALLYPGIRPRIRTTRWQDFKLRSAMRQGWTKARVPIPLDDPRLFTSHPKWQRYIEEDPHSLHFASVGFLSASRDLDRIAGRVPDRIACPVLLMLAGRDRIIDNGATRRYFAELAANRGTTPRGRLLEYPDSAHTLEFEQDRDGFVADLLTWLDEVRASRRVGSAHH